MTPAMRTTVLLATAAACAAAAAGCSVRDDASAVDSATATGTSPADTGAQLVIPDRLPAVTDTAPLPGAVPRDLPPVAGETSKRRTDDPRERDSVTAPLFEVGPDGKVRPIKRPPY